MENINKGVDYMLMAAEAGDRSAMLYMAKAYETGVGLGENRSAVDDNDLFLAHFISRNRCLECMLFQQDSVS